MRAGRWKLHLSVAGVAIAAMTLALTPAVADPLPDTDEYPDVAFLARNDVPFDAQTAASMAAQLGAPMFITNPKALSDAAADGIADLNPDVLIVAGGEFAVSDDVANAAAERCDPDCDVDRRFGTGRDETAAALASIAADYGFDRPVLQGSRQVVGDVNVGGTINADAITVQDTGLVSGLNADQLDGRDDYFHPDNDGPGSSLDADTVDGIDSPQLQLPNVLPSGRTLQGFYAVEGDSNGSGSFGTGVSFQLPLPANLDDSSQVHFIASGDSPPAECPGSSYEAPQADPGHLCVYEAFGLGYNSVSICSPTSCPRADRLGFTVWVFDDGTGGRIASWGTWAVTAP